LSLAWVPFFLLSASLSVSPIFFIYFVLFYFVYFFIYNDGVTAIFSTFVTFCHFFFCSFREGLSSLTRVLFGPEPDVTFLAEGSAWFGGSRSTAALTIALLSHTQENHPLSNQIDRTPCMPHLLKQ
jgi:ABC-type Na+ efflux pump permease subunit